MTLLLSIDVGNTNTVLGVYDGRASCALGSRRAAARTADEYGDPAAGTSSRPRASTRASGRAMWPASCPRSPRCSRLVGRYLGREPLVIGPGVKTGMPILYEPPGDVGADRIVNGVAAYAAYGGP